MFIAAESVVCRKVVLPGNMGTQVFVFICKYITENCYKLPYIWVVIFPQLEQKYVGGMDDWRLILFLTSELFRSAVNSKFTWLLLAEAVCKYNSELQDEMFGFPPSRIFLQNGIFRKCLMFNNLISYLVCFSCQQMNVCSLSSSLLWYCQIYLRWKFENIENTWLCSVWIYWVIRLQTLMCVSCWQLIWG